MGVVYAALNSDEEILYIGRTTDLERRKAEHAQTSPWWPLVERFWVMFRSSDDHDVAELAEVERSLIAQETPPFNIQHGDAKNARKYREKAWLWLSARDLNSAVLKLCVAHADIEQKLAELQWGLEQIEQYGGDSVVEAHARQKLPRIVPLPDDEPQWLGGDAA